MCNMYIYRKMSKKDWLKGLVNMYRCCLSCIIYEYGDVLTSLKYSDIQYMKERSDLCETNRLGN